MRSTPIFIKSNRSTTLAILNFLLFVGIAGISADADQAKATGPCDLWAVLTSKTKPTLVTLNINGELVAHLPKVVLDKFFRIKEYLEEFPSLEAVDMGPLLNITEENADEYLHISIKKLLPEVIRHAVTGQDIVYPDLPNYEANELRNLATALHVRISMALGECNKNFECRMRDVMRKCELGELLKLERVFGLDSWEFGRLLHKHRGVGALLVYSAQLGIDKDKYLKEVIGQNPATHRDILELLKYISEFNILSPDTIEGFKVFVDLACFDFNQCYEFFQNSLRPCNTGNILLLYCLQNGCHQACKILIKFMCAKRIIPKPGFKLCEPGQKMTAADAMRYYSLYKDTDIAGFLFECITDGFM